MALAKKLLIVLYLMLCKISAKAIGIIHFSPRPQAKAMGLFIKAKAMGLFINVIQPAICENQRDLRGKNFPQITQIYAERKKQNVAVFYSKQKKL